ncbi:alpha/beta fold hydrolase [Myceligenerans crystallogenes]|uniref:Alpha/beta hydrolase n=1 Tax=Myceligenerans crystallogenes TaxID=316335 RepID=A0ABP4ZUC0_9MICO
MTTRRTAALVAALALMTTAAAPAMAEPAAPGADAARAPAVAAPELDWRDCPDGADAFDCTSVELPSDYDRPHGPTTTVAVTRLPATGPGERLGSVFVNFGGPGGEGVSTLHAIGHELFEPSVREKFDIVAFDPRGVGASDPATCYPDQESEDEALAGMLALPHDRRQERRFLAEAAQVGLACATMSPDRFGTASSANVARDMDLLRQAVGDEKLTYVGYSYGTILGATYGMLFPGNVRAMVLDGPLDPRQWSGVGSRELLGTRLLQARGGHEAFAELWRLCEQAGPAECSTAGLGDAATVAEQVLTEIRRTPAEVPMPDGGTITYTYDMLLLETFFSLYTVAGYEPVADVYTYFAGLLGIGPATRSRTAAPDVPEFRLGREDYPSVGTALGTLCADVEVPRNPLTYPRQVRELNERYPHFGLLRGWVGVHCAFLPVEDEDAYQGPWIQSAHVPVLVIGTRFDPATHYDHTAPYASLWPDARTLTIEGYGHTSQNAASPCAHAAIADYLLTLAAQDGTVCEGAKPFTPADPRATNELRPELPAPF